MSPTTTLANTALPVAVLAASITISLGVVWILHRMLERRVDSLEDHVDQCGEHLSKHGAHLLKLDARCGYIDPALAQHEKWLEKIESQVDQLQTLANEQTERLGGAKHQQSLQVEAIGNLSRILLQTIEEIVRLAEATKKLNQALRDTLAPPATSVNTNEGCVVVRGKTYTPEKNKA